MKNRFAVLVALTLVFLAPAAFAGQFEDGMACVEKGRFAEAVKSLYAVATSGARNADQAYFLLGLCYEKMEQPSNAQRFYQYVLQCYPQSAARLQCENGLKRVAPLQITVPFVHGEHGHILTDAVINGRKVTVIIDTGCSISCVGPNQLTALGLDMDRKHPGVMAEDGTGASSRSGVSTATVIRLGTLLRPVQFLVSGSVPFPVLGRDYLSGCQIDVDNKNMRLTISRGMAEETAIAANDNGKTVIPFKKRGNVIYVPVTVNGHKREMVFDTGAEYITMSESEAWSLGIHADKGRKSGASSFTGSVKAYLVKITTVQFGVHEAAELPAMVIVNGPTTPLFSPDSVLRGRSYRIDAEKSVIVLN